ncbi:GNAT family protein [Methanoregula sp.]|uniref:GNAT family N-acetyltransferase n=1 Tax=Methanoregula sp. TaxID=2052170 RepID=UPI002634B515|nr:GNAT family protein [Methanoregula sp.]MDD5142020.1 GNAT family protein [Methanoregula sp.]
MQIITPSAILRDWSADDVSSLVRFANNPRIAATLRDGFPSLYTSGDAERFITQATAPESRNLILAIEVDAQACGAIGIHPLEDVYHRTAEIGYWLAEPYWGRGIVTDAVRAIVPVAFDRYDIVRIQAGIFSNNPASMQVLEKCGFIREAIHKDAVTKNGVTMDEVMFVRFR